MLPKTFKIVYLLNGKTISTECSAYSLHEYIDKLIEDGSKVICLFAKNNKSKKPLDENKVEMTKYYNSRYNYYYKQYKSNRIDKITFEKIKEELKTLRKGSKNVKEFADKFVIYEKKELKKG